METVLMPVRIRLFLMRIRILSGSESAFIIAFMLVITGNYSNVVRIPVIEGFFIETVLMPVWMRLFLMRIRIGIDFIIHKMLYTVLWIRIRIWIQRLHMFLCPLDPDPEPLVRDIDPDPAPSIIIQKREEKHWFLLVYAFFSLKMVRMFL
jgi:hypothetical protein